MGIEYKVIGRHIRAARKRMHMTQEDVAAAITNGASTAERSHGSVRPI